jgi:hypothetical protein
MMMNFICTPAQRSLSSKRIAKGAKHAKHAKKSKRTGIDL